MTAFSFLLLFFFFCMSSLPTTLAHSQFFLPLSLFLPFIFGQNNNIKQAYGETKREGFPSFFFFNVSFLLPQLVFVSLFLFLLDADRSQQRVPAACLIQKNTRCSSFFFFCCCCFDYTIALLQQRFSVDRPLLLLLFLLLLSLFLRQL